MLLTRDDGAADGDHEPLAEPVDQAAARESPR